MVPVALDVGWLKVPYVIGMDERLQLKKNTSTRAISLKKNNPHLVVIVCSTFKKQTG